MSDTISYSSFHNSIKFIKCRSKTKIVLLFSYALNGDLAEKGTTYI